MMKAAPKAREVSGNNLSKSRTAVKIGEFEIVRGCVTRSGAEGDCDGERDSRVSENHPLTRGNTTNRHPGGIKAATPLRRNLYLAVRLPRVTTCRLKSP